MKKQEVQQKLLDIFRESSGNVISQEQAEYPEVAGLQIYEEPILGFGDAEDSLFEKFKEPGVVGPWMLGPKEWIPSAKSVISVFMPFSKQVKESNAKMKDICSHEWAYARIEGQAFMMKVMEGLAQWFRDQGEEAVMPAGDPRFFSVARGKIKSSDPEKTVPGIQESTFSSNWSERHTAFACGLGTFGLSRGLITKKGMAGRFGSIIVSAELPADERPYTDIYEYCIRCGACARNCPANAFTLPEGLKDHLICQPHVAYSATILKPRYGCGLCQVNVPCQNGIPLKK